MGIRGEIFSTRLILPNRTYFLNVKENRLGDLYLNIVESKNKETGGFERQSLIVFAEDLPSFLGEFDKALRVLEKEARGQKRGGGKRSEEQPAYSTGDGGGGDYNGAARARPRTSRPPYSGEARPGRGRRAAFEDRPGRGSREYSGSRSGRGSSSSYGGAPGRKAGYTGKYGEHGRSEGGYDRSGPRRGRPGGERGKPDGERGKPYGKRVVVKRRSRD